MVKSHEQSKEEGKSRKYQKIDKEERKQVLQLLLNEKLPIQEVATKLGLKYCTVRTIQNAYEKEGRIGKKETRKQKVKIENVIYITILNPVHMNMSPTFHTAQEGHIYVDRNPSALDQQNINMGQHNILNSQWVEIQQGIMKQLSTPMDRSNMLIRQFMQNLLIGVQVVGKNIHYTPQMHIKQEGEMPSPLSTTQLFNPHQLNQLKCQPSVLKVEHQ